MHLLSCLFACLLAFTVTAAHAAEQSPSAASSSSSKPIQFWGRAFWPEKQNGTKGGLVVELMAHVTSRLPQYQHHYQVMSLNRGFNDLKQRNDLCVVGVVRTPERDKWGYFVGLWPLLPPQLVIRRVDWQRINNGQPSISLKALLQRQDLRGATARVRSYGSDIDALVDAAERAGQMDKIQTSSKNNNLLNMLAVGRIDFTPEYIESFVASAQAQPEFPQKFVLLVIDEAQQPSVAGIYCSRSPRGEQLIRQIEQIARDPAVGTQFQTMMYRSIPGELRQPYQQWMDEFFQQRPEKNLTNLPD